MKYIKYLIISVILLIGCQNQTNKEKSNSIKDNEESETSKEDKKKLLNNVKIIEPIDTLINTEKYVVLANKNAKIRIIKSGDTLKYTDFEIVEYIEELLVVAKNLDKSTLEIYAKYNPNLTFSDFQVNIFDGPLVEPDFDSFPWAKRYITRITETCKSGINFAGKYTLVIWGCGSPCQKGAIVDRTNGKIYDGYFSAYGSKFRKDSKLIILNSMLIDEESNLITLHPPVEVTTEIWNGSKFKRL